MKQDLLIFPYISFHTRLYIVTYIIGQIQDCLLQYLDCVSQIHCKNLILVSHRDLQLCTKSAMVVASLIPIRPQCTTEL